MVTGAKSDNQSRGYQKLSSLCHAAASKRRDMQQGAQEGSLYVRDYGTFFLVPCALTCTDFSEPQTLYGDEQENLGLMRGGGGKESDDVN